MQSTEELAVLVSDLQARLAAMEAAHASMTVASDTAWVASAAIWVLLMQVGFAMFEAGSCRQHNVIATFAKNLLDVLISIMVGLFFGYNLAFPEEEVHVLELDGSDAHHGMRQSFFFYVVFEGTASTIVSGSMAERTTLQAYFIYSIVMSGILYAMVCRATWGGGFLSTMDTPFHDFAGSGIVHLTGGTAALIGAAVVGPRAGRFDPEMAGAFAAHNIPTLLTGMFFLWVGWYGFNCGSTGALSTAADASAVSNAFVTTTFSAACGGTVILVLSMAKARGHTFDLLGVANGILGGLVSITAGCDAIEAGASCIVGLVGGLLSLGTSLLMKKLKIDDVVDAFAVHGACGIWGCLAVGLFHPQNGLFFGGGGSQLLTQFLGVIYIIAVTSLPTYAVMKALGFVGFLRVSHEVELKGLDAKVLNISAYSDLSLVTKKEPQMLFVNSRNHQQACHGEYQLVEGVRPNDMPLWQKVGGTRWIYSGTDGKWWVGDTDEQKKEFKCACGYLQSTTVHEGSMPDFMKQWRYFKGGFHDDESINVTRKTKSTKTTEKTSLAFSSS